MQGGLPRLSFGWQFATRVLSAPFNVPRAKLFALSFLQIQDQTLHRAFKLEEDIFRFCTSLLELLVETLQFGNARNRFLQITL